MLDVSGPVVQMSRLFDAGHVPFPFDGGDGRGLLVVVGLSGVAFWFIDSPLCSFRLFQNSFVFTNLTPTIQTLTRRWYAGGKE